MIYQRNINLVDRYKLEHIRTTVYKISSILDDYAMTQKIIKLPLRYAVLRVADIPLVYMDANMFSDKICSTKEKIGLVIKVSDIAIRWNIAVGKRYSIEGIDKQINSSNIDCIYEDWKNIVDPLINNTDILHNLYTIEI